MFADGSNGSVELVGNSIIIRRKGFTNVLTQGVQGNKQVPLKSITAVQFRPAGSMMAGLIQFSIVGGREFRGGMLEATKDENAVMFTREQEAAFAALRDTVQRYISQPDRPTAGNGSANELERLSALHRAGHLTADEFADAKRQALSGSSIEAPAAPAYQQTHVHGRQPLEQKKPGGCLKAMAIIVGVLVLGVVMNPGPRWGEPGYKPHISDECRAVWASANVNADKYVKTICTPDEQHEIAGYKLEE